MGTPWIKSEIINKEDLEKYFGKVRFEDDAISFADCIGMIVDRINEAEEEKIKALAENKKYKEEINADARVQELIMALEEAKANACRSFQITENEAEKIDKWKNQHDIKIHKLVSLEKRLKAGGAIGGRYEYNFIPTSIGTIGYCVCGACKHKAFTEAKGDVEKYSKLKKKYDAEFQFTKL